MTAMLQSLMPLVGTMNSAINEICEDEKEKELKLKESNHILLIIVENHMKETVFVQWGAMADDKVTAVDLIPMPPKTAIGRKFHVQKLRVSSHRPTVQIWKADDPNAENVFSLLWQPGDDPHTTVFIITETNVTLQHNPNVRNWVKGDIQLCM
jgi:hypothetical protein